MYLCMRFEGYNEDYNLPKFQVDRILRLQKWAIRLIARKNRLHSCRTLFPELNILTFPSLFLFHASCYGRKLASHGPVASETVNTHVFTGAVSLGLPLSRSLSKKTRPCRPGKNPRSQRTMVQRRERSKNLSRSVVDRTGGTGRLHLSQSDLDSQTSLLAARGSTRLVGRQH